MRRRRTRNASWREVYEMIRERGPQRPGKIAEEIGIHSSTVSRIMKGLVRDGLVAKERGLCVALDPSRPYEQPEDLRDAAIRLCLERGSTCTQDIIAEAEVSRTAAQWALHELEKNDVVFQAAPAVTRGLDQGCAVWMLREDQNAE